jgi:hypothetical protein
MTGTICNSKLWTVTALFSLALGAYGQSAGAPAGMKEKTNLRNVRYCEVFVARRHGMSATASVYNTLGLNDCPADKWAALSVDKLKDELHAVQVILNGPRYFTMDRNALANPGEVKTFDGLDARLVAQLEIKSRQKREPYTENTVERQSQYVYEQGKSVYELVSADGHVYIMQSYSQEIDKNLDESGLLMLAGRLKLPKGWQYRTRKLDQDLVVRNSGGQAHVVQDDLRNSYQLMQ